MKNYLITSDEASTIARSHMHNKYFKCSWKSYDEKMFNKLMNHIYKDIRHSSKKGCFATSINEYDFLILSDVFTIKDVLLGTDCAASHTFKMNEVDIINKILNNIKRTLNENGYNVEINDESNLMKDIKSNSSETIVFTTNELIKIHW